MQFKYWIQSLLCAVTLLGASACKERVEAPLPAPAVAADINSEPSGSGTLQKVEARKVCMINNRVMANDQIPVTIGDRTYFGCCPMCKERLEREEGARTAVDPVSGLKVDKALAVIGATATGEVHYFESAENLRRFARAQ